MIKSLRLGLATALAVPLLSAPPSDAAEPLRFAPCPTDPAVECATISVPLDYTAPGGRQIPIAISRIRASGTPAEYRGALLVNPGGPGGAGLDYAAAKRAKMPEAVRRSYDIVGFDPRGVGASNPVDCGPLGGLFQHPAPDPVPTTAAEERDHLGRLQRMAADCQRHSGPVLPYINTANTARDMDRIRQALRQPRLNFLGVSYGSYLGGDYAAEFPSRVGRMVLDSVVSPGRWHDFDAEQGFAMLAQRDVLFRWIAAHPSLGLGTTPETVRASYLAARSALATRPAHGTFGAAEFDYLVYRTLSRTERWEPFARALDAYLHRGDSGGFGTEMPDSPNYESALRTVKCADSTRPSTDEVLGSIRALRSADPQPVLAGVEAEVCRYWGPPREVARLGDPAMPPVLLVQAAHDPTTPYAGARRMQAALPGSRMVVLDRGYSHGVFASQRNGCVDGTVERYLLSGILPSGDVHCAGTGLPTLGGS